MDKLKPNKEIRISGVNRTCFLYLNANTYFMTTYEKVYIAVYLRIDIDGFMKPVAIEWTDGTLFEINKIIDERNAPPEHTGGALTRKDKVIIKEKEKILYLDKQIWSKRKRVQVV